MYLLLYNLHDCTFINTVTWIKLFHKKSLKHEGRAKKEFSKRLNKTWFPSQTRFTTAIPKTSYQGAAFLRDFWEKLVFKFPEKQKFIKNLLENTCGKNLFS